MAVESVGTASVTFLPAGHTIEIGEGVTLLQAARQVGEHIDAPCGESGKCGKCRVIVKDGLCGEMSEHERKLLKPEEIAAGVRLSCEAVPLGRVTVEIPETSRNMANRKAAADLLRPIAAKPYTRKVCVQVPPPSVTERDFRDDLTRLRQALPEIGSADLDAARELHAALETGKQTVTAVLAGDRLIAVETGDTTRTHYGLALDIGTTTLVGYLMDLRTGEEVAVNSQPNPQAAYGADVISRIEFAMGDQEKVETLRTTVTRAVNTILHNTAKDARITAGQIYEMTMVGNTCMSHLFLGIDPLSLGHAPYTPTLTDSMSLAAAELGLSMHPRGRVRTLPNIAGFVGADTVGVLAAADLEHCTGLHAAVDIGTNAEVMLSENGRLSACSTAAGPAFEGAKISQGMRAQPGAIDAVTIGDDIFIHTIGNKPAQGICGSGIIDALGELRRVGLLEASGRFADPEDLAGLPEALLARLTDDGVVLAWAKDSGNGHDIVLTRQDVREVQLVKASIYAGIATLLQKLGHTPEELDGLHIAGAFGTYITKEHAVAIGLIPNIPLEKLVFLGNGAGIGAKMALISRDEYAAVCAAARNVEYVELAGDEIFRDNYTMAMMLAPGCEDDW
ncbi:MAG: ASKHA domain-containing protein [Armatimonadota bacterium]